MAIAAAAITLLRARAAAAIIALDPHSPWAAQDSWRPNLPGQQTLTLRHHDTTTQIAATPDGDTWRLDWDSIVRTAAARTDTNTMLLRLDSAAGRVTVVQDSARLIVVLDGANHMFDVADPLAAPEASANGAAKVMAPIPGRVASLLVRSGDTVKRGQVLLVLEAMKMEFPLIAPRDGTIARLRCAEGEMVEEGVELVELDDA